MAVATSVALVAGLEATARTVEPWLAPARQLPTPEPGTEQARGFHAVAAAARKAAGVAEPPDLGGAVFDPDPGVHQVLVSDGHGGWGLPAGGSWVKGTASYRVNRLGLRGPEVTPRTSDELRILTCGDSSIFGDGVSEDAVFSSVAAAILAHDLQRPATAVIGAIPGFDSAQSLATLKALGGPVQPTWLVIGNLWSDLYRRDAHLDLNAERARTGLRQLATYRLLWTALGPLLAPQKVGWVSAPEDVADGLEHEARVGFEAYVRNLRAMVAEAGLLNARVAFVVLPAPMDFDKAPPPPTVEAYRDGMRAVAQESHAVLVDGPALFKAGGGGIADFLDQVHPAPTGHRLLGVALARAIEAEQAP